MFRLILEVAIAVVVLPVVVGLELSITGLGIALHAESVLGLFIRDQNLGDLAALAGGLGEELGLARVLEAEEQERGLVDGVANGERAVVLQDAGLVGRAQRLGDEFTLCAGQHDAAVRVVHRVGVVELAGILCQHLQWFAEHAPCLAVDGVCVADGDNVGPRLVHLAVDEEACGIGWSRAVSAHDLALQVHGDHVASPQQPEVLAQWVRPEHVVRLWVPHADVARDALHIPFARPVAECRRHVLQLPLSLQLHRRELRHARKHHVAVRDRCQRALVLHPMFVVFLLRLDGF